MSPPDHAPNQYPDIDRFRAQGAPSSAPNQYPEIDQFREPGSTSKLFPAPTPPPSDETPGVETPNAGPRRNGRRAGAGLGGGGQHRRGQRVNDMLLADADADPLDLRVAYRRAKTTAIARDPGLAGLLVEANRAETDVQKRAVLKVYYTRLFDGIRKADPSPEMKKHVELLAEVAQQRYDPQRRAVGGEEDIIRGGGGRRGRNR